MKVEEQKEKEKIRVALRNCGYPEWDLKEGEQRGKTKLRKEQEPKTQELDQGEESNRSQFAILPYMKGVTKRLQRAFRKHNIRLYSKAGFTVRNAVVSPKDPLDTCEQCGVIYECSCEVCEKIYVGETGRCLVERVEEHANSLERGYEKSPSANIS